MPAKVPRRIQSERPPEPAGLEKRQLLGDRPGRALGRAGALAAVDMPGPARAIISFSSVPHCRHLAGIMGRVVAGTANDPNARERGERARPLAEVAGRLVEQGLTR